MKDTKAVWDEFSDEILRYFKARTKNKDAAEDLRQEVFLRIHQHLSSLRDQKKIAHWISVITRNVMADYWKKSAPIAGISEIMVCGPEKSALEQMAENCVHGLLSSLPEKYAKPILLGDLQGMKQEQVAQELGLSHSGAKSRIQRGREMLKKAIMDCCRPQLNVRMELVSSACVEEGSPCKGISECP